MLELQATDPEIFSLLKAEEQYEAETVRLIPSENYASTAVLEAVGSVFMNKYSEGYPGKRYYEGQQYVDQLEEIAIARAKSLFGVDHANVQPYSGSPANMAVYYALLQPGDTIMGLSLPHGGHLTHGWDVSALLPFLPFRSLRRRPRDPTHRLRRRPRAGEERTAEADHRRRHRLPARVRLPGLRRYRQGGRRLLPRRHRPHRRPHRRRRPPEPRALRRRHHDDDAQDAARAARGDDHVPRRAGAGDRPGGLPRPPGRPSRSHDRRHRRRSQGGGDAGVPRVRAAGRQQRQGAGRRASGARLRPRHGRDGQPPPGRSTSRTRRSSARRRRRRWTGRASSSTTTPSPTTRGSRSAPAGYAWAARRSRRGG